MMPDDREFDGAAGSAEVRSDQADRSHRSWHGRAGSRSAFSEQGPHVGDVVLGYRHREAWVRSSFEVLRVSRHLPSRTYGQHERPNLIKGFLGERLAWTGAQDACGPRSTEQQRGFSAE
jgi:hypothetical protein